ncbi:DNA-binding response regulator [Arthrobacter sp. AFG7.2]|uniref:response regulator transcription factor n=1 Tax=Arthrobacter sp. AFG7.2 TaxID=1688693 RepID=UPI000C9EBF87|nr:response regulator transcription factor [Arthrobacter sp. AFG7.2]PNI08910.1 DNA-binding response regulator [Arthrobacter sp. AFG7.2]
MTAEAVDGGVAKTSVLVIDDHTSFAELLTAAIDHEPDLQGLGFARNATTGLQMCRSLQPDVVVVSSGRPEGLGLGIAADLMAASPGTHVVMLVSEPTSEGLAQAAAAGASAFLARGTPLTALLGTVRHSHSGVIEVDPQILAAFATQAPPHSQVSAAPLLTKRQMDVLKLMAEGKDVRSNAKTLGISQNTCRGYVKAIHSRLGVHSQLEAVVMARQLGLLAVGR